MRDFVILGSSIVTPPNPSSSSSSSSPIHSPSNHNHRTIKPHKKPSLPKLTLQSPITHHNHGAKLNDLETVLEGVLRSGLHLQDLSQQLIVGIRGGGGGSRKVRIVIDALKRVQELGISLSHHFDGTAIETIGKECRCLVKCGQIEDAVELMEVLSRFQLSVRELVQPSDIIKSCVLSCKPDLAVRYACLLPHAKILICNIICEFGKRRDLVSALKAYEASKKSLDSPNMYIYRAIIDACGLCGESIKSRYIYEELLNQKITPNIYVANSLMNVNTHDLSYTLNVYKNMQNLGLKPDMTSYNILLKACCVAGRVDMAQDIYRELKDLESVGKLKLDVFTYSTIIKVFADAKMWQMALNIKKDMMSAGVSLNIVAWSSLINAFAHAGLVEQAIQLFEEMLLAGCEPNTQCFNIILHACVEACQYDRAFRFFYYWKGNKTMGSLGEGNNSKLEHTATIVPNGISSSHILSFAERFPFRPTIATYNILLKACGTDYYHAKALIKEMKRAGLSPNQISWSILIDICGGSENVDGAIEILNTMFEARIKPDVVAYTTAIKVCVESKNFKQALSLYEEMRRYEIHPNWVTYNTLLRARSKYGSVLEVQQCLIIYQDMRKAGYKHNDYYLEQVIEEWCEGVLQEQDDRENQREFSSRNISESDRPQSPLLEKIAAHLLKRVADILAIDVQGLSKVEARLVVLAVLRMIKENYASGYSVNDDILIIIGATKADETPAENILEVQEAIMKLLQNELELEVVPAKTRFAPIDPPKLENLTLSNLSKEALPGKNAPLPAVMGFQNRRPAVLHRLKFTKKSLYHWLHRKISIK